MIIRKSQEPYPPEIRKEQTKKEVQGIVIGDAACTEATLRAMVGTTIIPILGKDAEFILSIIGHYLWG